MGKLGIYQLKPYFSRNSTFETRSYQIRSGILLSGFLKVGFEDKYGLYFLLTLPDIFWTNAGLFFQYIKIKYTGTPVKMMAIPIPKIKQNDI